MQLALSRANGKISESNINLRNGLNAIDGNEDYAKQVENGIVDLDWLRNSFNKSWTMLHHDFEKKWKSTLTLDFLFWKDTDV